MARLDLGPVGAVLAPSDPELLQTARAVEALGYRTIWLTGGPLQSLETITDVMRATHVARIGTAIIAVDRFAARDVADLYRDLDTDHPGRFVVGLGGAHGPRPLATLTAYLDELAAVPAQRRLLAALGPKMLGLARERTAGAFPVLATPSYIATARAALGPDSTLAVMELAALDPDHDVALEVARRPLQFLGSVPAYQAHFRRMGFAEEDITGLSEHLVTSLAAVGDAAAVAERIAVQHAAGADHVAVNLSTAAPEALVDGYRQVAEALGDAVPAPVTGT